MITFKLAEHSVRRGCMVVEVWRGDHFLATITPGVEPSLTTLHLTTKFPIEVAHVPGVTNFLAIKLGDV